MLFNKRNENHNLVFTEDSISKIIKFDPFMTLPEVRNLYRYTPSVICDGNMSFTKEIYKKTNGFDETLPEGISDTDLAFRCDQNGILIKTVPEAKMFHLNHPLFYILP